MRLDKYLKTCRIIKRRTVSKDIISLGHVLLNGRVAKPASNVKVGDVITLYLGDKKVTIRVLNILNTTKKEDALSLYEIINEEKIENEES